MSSSRHIAAILDTVGEGVFGIDSQHTIRMVNRETERIFGYDRAELQGKPVFMLIPDGYRTHYDKAFESALSADAPMEVRYEEVEGLRKDGTTFPLEVRFTRGPLGDDIVVVAAARDITDRVAARAEIEWLHAQLVEERDTLLNEVDGLREEVRAFRQMGSFTLQKQIGVGGMGEVWRASHRMLARPAAVKLIRREWLDGTPEGAGVLTRFEREAQVTASLKSPHTVSLYDFGVDGKGVLYYVMELLVGIDLDTLVSEHGPQPPERVAYLLAQACHSLKEAHDRGLIHRDIKPENLVTCRYGNDLDFVKVLDFGLVTPQPKWMEAADHLTAEGETPGTPEYMAPEQITDPNEVDHRSDLYTLACVAYYLLTGQLVFPTSSPMSMLMAHVSKNPRPPSENSPFAVPEALDAIVLDCLQKKPGDRPADAGVLRDRLQALEFENPWDDRRIRAWWTRHGPSE